MGFGDLVEINYGKPDFPDKNKPIETVLRYVLEKLPDFIETENGKNWMNEDVCTENLVVHLNCCLSSNYPFVFTRESIEKKRKGHKPKVDIGVYTKKILRIDANHYSEKERFFAFEAKIMGVKEKHRDTEYVYGLDRNNQPNNAGGIERFKKNIHCHELKYAGMLGYIRKETAEFWLNKTNELITTYANSSETLKFEKKDSTNNIQMFISNHERNNGNEQIILYHIWFSLI